MCGLLSSENDKALVWLILRGKYEINTHVVIKRHNVIRAHATNPPIELLVTPSRPTLITNGPASLPITVNTKPMMPTNERKPVKMPARIDRVFRIIFIYKAQRYKLSVAQGKPEFKQERYPPLNRVPCWPYLFPARATRVLPDASDKPHLGSWHSSSRYMNQRQP